MSDKYYFSGQFKCMYCQEDFDPERMLSLADGDSIDFQCPKCKAVWKFWVSVQLNHKLLKRGKYNKKETS